MPVKMETIWKRFRDANRMDNRVEDVAAFFGISEEKAAKRLRVANDTVSKEWQAMKGRLTGRNLFKYYSSDWWLLKRLQRQTLGYFWRTLMRYVYELPKNQAVLDYGCGAGEYSIFAASRGHDVTAFEIAGISAEWLRWFTRRSSPRLNIDVITSPNVWKPAEAEEGHFDVVIAAAVFEHIVEPQKIASQLIKYLKPGGRLYALCGFAASARGHLQKSIEQYPAVEKILRSREDVDVTIVRDIDGKPL